MAQSLCSQMGNQMDYSPSVISLGEGDYFIPYPTINNATKNFGCGFIHPTSWSGPGGDAPMLPDLQVYPCCKYDPANKKLLYDQKTFYWNYQGNTESDNLRHQPGGTLVLIFSPLEKNIFSIFGAITDSDRAEKLIPAHQLFIGPGGSSRDYMVYGLTNNDNQYVIACEGGGYNFRSVVTYKLTTITQQTYVALQKVICNVLTIPNLYICSPNENNVITAYFNLFNYNAYQHMTKAGFSLGDYDYRGCLNPGNETLFFIRTDHIEESDILDIIGLEEEGEFEDDDEGIEYEDD
jgi:hypothetical protein